MSVIMLRPLRWMCKVNRQDKIGIRYIRVGRGVALNVDKKNEARMRWLENVLIRENTEVVRLVKEEMHVDGMWVSARTIKIWVLIINYI